MTAVQITGAAEILLAVALVALCGWFEYLADQKKRSRK